MTILISLLIIVAVVAVAIWLVKMIPFPADLEIIRFGLIAFIAITGLMKVIALL